ncbi:hypothetical protein EDB83DRAFT_2314378 [Lactarius deliciosus]|nr:hypothetical protein EDB83DRAFT_2314378 [Lactarius deliciosus]
MCCAWSIVWLAAGAEKGGKYQIDVTMREDKSWAEHSLDDPPRCAIIFRNLKLELVLSAQRSTPKVHQEVTEKVPGLSPGLLGLGVENQTGRTTFPVDPNLHAGGYYCMANPTLLRLSYVWGRPVIDEVQNATLATSSDGTRSSWRRRDRVGITMVQDFCKPSGAGVQYSTDMKTARAISRWNTARGDVIKPKKPFNEYSNAN